MKLVRNSNTFYSHYVYFNTLKYYSFTNRHKTTKVKEEIFMVDTIDVEYIFSNKKDYNNCFILFDSIAEKNGERLHKQDRNRYRYITSAFNDFGWLKVKFGVYERGYALRISWKPSTHIYNKNPIALSKPGDYLQAEEYFNSVISQLNHQAGKELLPHLDYWNVLRFDYAINLYTPYTREYIRLFYAGFIPKGFHIPHTYTTSFYMKSNSLKYNIYDKCEHLKQKYHYKDEDINSLLKGRDISILRLEIQCFAKEIARIKEKFLLPNRSVKALWQPDIARDILAKRTSAIIGSEDIFTYEQSTDMLLHKYANRTYENCEPIIRRMATMKAPSLQLIKEVLADHGERNMFNSLVYKIRQSGANPIPLESCYDGTDISYLINPYNCVMAYFH